VQAAAIPLAAAPPPRRHQPGRHSRSRRCSQLRLPSARWQARSRLRPLNS
jgi:hypothetical protein